MNVAGMFMVLSLATASPGSVPFAVFFSWPTGALAGTELFVISTLAPGIKRVCPSVTTVSPGFRPWSMTASVPNDRDETTGRDSTVLSDFTDINKGSLLARGNGLDRDNGGGALLGQGQGRIHV